MKTQLTLLATVLTASVGLAHADSLSTETFIGSANGFHVTSTLVKGEREMVLIDGQFLQSDAHRLVARMLESGLSLNAILVTHAHPDHTFGLDVILASFPETPVYATKEVVSEIARLGPPKLAYWKPQIGANLTNQLVEATSLENDHLLLEGKDIRVLPLGQADTGHNTVFYIPSASTLVTGDLTYSDIHPWTAETTVEHRKEWLANLSKLEDFVHQYHVTTLIAGHQLESSSTSPLEVIAFNQGYLTDFLAAENSLETAPELETKMKNLYPSLQLPIILTLGSQAAFSH